MRSSAAAWMRSHALWASAFGALAAVCGSVGYLRVMTTFSVFDDEGYVLLTIREFLARGALYDEVYSQYGPFFAQFWAAIVGGLGIELDHDAARILVLLTWLATSLLIGVSVWRITELPLVGLGAQLLTFVSLEALINEPLHPGGLTCLLLAALLAATAIGLPRHPRFVASSIGVLLAALTLTKINVGALATLGVLLAASLTLPGMATRRLVRVAAISVVLAPGLLMARDLTHAWVQRLAIVVSAGLAALIVTAWPRAAALRSMRAPPDLRSAVAGPAAFGITTVAIGVVAVATGTTPSSLVDGVIIDPLQHASVFTVAFGSPRAVVAYAVALLALSILIRRSHALGRTGRAGLQLFAGTTILVAIADPTFGGVIRDGISPLLIAVPLAWVAATHLDDRSDEPTWRFGTVLLPALATLQALHAYPVAGSQVAWATYLFVPVGAVCVGSAWAILKTVNTGRIAIAAAAVLIVLVAGERMVGSADMGYTAFRDGSRVGLAGTDRMRLPPHTVSVLQGVAGEVESRCSSFVTLPGMNSFYLFTDRRPPTGLNTTSWMYLLDRDAQRTVVDALQSHDAVCVVTNGRLLAGWAQGRPSPDRALFRFATTDLRVVARHGDYTVAVKR